MNKHSSPRTEPPPPRSIAKWTAAVVTVCTAASTVYGLWADKRIVVLGLVGMVFAIVLLVLVSRAAKEIEAGRPSRFYTLAVRGLVAFVLLYFMVLAAMMFPVLLRWLTADPPAAATGAREGTGPNEPAGGTHRASAEERQDKLIKGNAMFRSTPDVGAPDDLEAHVFTVPRGFEYVLASATWSVDGFKPHRVNLVRRRGGDRQFIFELDSTGRHVDELGVVFDSGTELVLASLTGEGQVHYEFRGSLRRQASVAAGLTLGKVKINRLHRRGERLGVTVTSEDKSWIPSDHHLTLVVSVDRKMLTLTTLSTVDPEKPNEPIELELQMPSAPLLYLGLRLNGPRKNIVAEGPAVALPVPGRQPSLADLGQLDPEQLLLWLNALTDSELDDYLTKVRERGTPAEFELVLRKLSNLDLAHLVWRRIGTVQIVVEATSEDELINDPKGFLERHGGFLDNVNRLLVSEMLR